MWDRSHESILQILPNENVMWLQNVSMDPWVENYALDILVHNAFASAMFIFEKCP